MWPFTNHKMDKPKVSVIYGQRPVVKKTDPQEKFRSYQQSWREHRYDVEYNLIPFHETDSIRRPKAQK